MSNSSLTRLLPEHWLLKSMLVIMGFMVVAFNVMGYDVLFHADPWIPFIPISPFGILLGCAEVAVLVWTSAVIADWSRSSRVLKGLIWVLVPAFAFLCYSGVNSYLNSLATAEIQKVEEVKFRTSNNSEYLATLEAEAESLQGQISQIRDEQVSLNVQINEKNSQYANISERASQRRLKSLNCMDVPDCASSVMAFESQMESIEFDTKSLNDSRTSNTQRLASLEQRLDEINSEIRTQKYEDIKNKNQYAGTESSFEIKKQAYERVVIGTASLVGWEPEDPFGVFVAFVSFLIYPVYFVLNLFIGLNSESNKEIRQLRLANKERAKAQQKERKSLRVAALKQAAKYLRAWVLRKKKDSVHLLGIKAEHARKRKSKRSEIYRKAVRYFRVWAHRRTKTLEKEVEKVVETEVVVEKEIEKIVEVEIEVEKTVEVTKEVPVEIKVEVPVEVERIVEVSTEVPVYIEKIKKVPEPVFIKDPQVIIHERVVPVPENITAEELEKLLNAQPRLNADARDAEEAVVVGVQGERTKEQSRPEQNDNEPSTSAA